MRRDSRKWARLAIVTLALGGLAACADGADSGTGPDPIDPGPGSTTAVVTGPITADRTFFAESTYVLSGFVQVASGATLTIRPGTKIVGDTTRAGSSLFILRGARLVAEGTAERPIVFTSQRPVGRRRPGDWGGIVIVGNARINRSVAGALTEGPASAAQDYAGGTDDDDSSGSLRYVRIEFAGYDVSGGQGQELNSLSMYAVGRGTRLQYVQVHAGLDDGFEWFGGTVDGQYLVSSEAGDDHFDWTEGYRGRNQFLVAYQGGRLQPAAGAGGLGSDPRGFEGDGCDSSVAGCNADYRLNQPASRPVFANFTLIGSREAGYPTGGNAAGMVLRRGTAGDFYHGVVARFNGFGISLRDAATDDLRREGELVVRDLVFLDNASNFEPAGTNFGQEASFADAEIAQPAGVAASYFASLDRGAPDLTPTNAAAFALGSAAIPAERVAGYPYGWRAATHVGAVAPAGPNWMAGWTSFPAN